MKKFLMWFGGASAVALMALVLMIGWSVREGKAATESGKAYAEPVLREILTDWDHRVLTRNATPQLLSDIGPDGPVNLFAKLRSLGGLVRFEKDMQTRNVFVGMAGDNTRVEFLVPAQFANGRAMINLTVEQQDGIWRIAGFWVKGDVNDANASKLTPQSL